MWWLIIPIAVFIVILCIVLNGEHERQVKQSARLPIDDSWLFEDNSDEPCVIEFETSDEKIIINEAMTDKIKLEDMTLSQIRELKRRIREEIAFAIEKTTKDYDVGVVLIDTESEVYKDDIGNPFHYTNNVTIRFSKEDETQKDQIKNDPR